jgi:hypothetical protein
MSLWTRYKEQSFCAKVVLIILLALALASLGLMTGVQGSSNSPGVPAASAAATPGPCASCPNNPVDLSHQYDDLTKAVVSEENVADAASIILAPVAPVAGTSAAVEAAPSLTKLTPKCHGRIYRRLYIKQPITGFTYGWRQTAIAWCYGSNGVITSTGSYTGNDGAYSNFAWCFQDVDFGKAWWNVSHTEVKVWNRGTLKVCARVVPGTRVLYPQIFAHGGTAARPYPFWNYGDRTKVYR